MLTHLRKLKFVLGNEGQHNKGVELNLYLLVTSLQCYQSQTNDRTGKPSKRGTSQNQTRTDTKNEPKNQSTKKT